MWLDSHCHLSADRFDADREEVADRALAAGVDTWISIGSGYGVEGNREARDLAHRWEACWATAGVHPHEASSLDDPGRRLLQELLGDERVVAVGECGLDYHYMNSPRPVQREVFAEQIGWARERELPLSLHLRGDDPDAYGEALDIWKSEGGGAVRGVLHCYSGTKEFAHRALDWGLEVSFSGIVTFKRSDDLRETARSLPLEHLMVETDAPFLAPEGHRGRRNEPAWVGRVGETLAELHGVPPEEMARITADNARRLFGLPAAKEGS